MTIEGIVAPDQIETKLFLQPLAGLVSKLSYFRRLERAWQLIEKDYKDNTLGLETAAKVSGISKNHLNVLLRQTTGFTFCKLLLRYRILRSTAMIRNKDYSLLEIVLENGFQSLTTFERQFHRLMGITPRQFRRKRDY